MTKELRLQRILFLRAETYVGFRDCAAAVDHGLEDVDAVINHLATSIKSKIPKGTTYWVWGIDCESNSQKRARLRLGYPR